MAPGRSAPQRIQNVLNLYLSDAMSRNVPDVSIRVVGVVPLHNHLCHQRPLLIASPSNCCIITKRVGRSKMNASILRACRWSLPSFGVVRCSRKEDTPLQSTRDRGLVKTVDARETYGKC